MTDKSEKVSHVLRAKQTRSHTCHWPGCPQQVAPALWGCRKHWFMLPKRLRDKIWQAYEPGQEDTMSPSDSYIEIAKEVQAWIANFTKGAS
jgi:hypothetical protein